MFVDNQKAIDDLLVSYKNLPWYTKWLFPRKLGRALNEYDNDKTRSPLPIVKEFWVSTFMSSAYFIQKWFFPILTDFRLNKFIDSFHTLFSTELLNGGDAQVNFNSIAEHSNPVGAALALRILHTAGLLTGIDAQANRRALSGHHNPDVVAKALCTLHVSGLLAGAGAQKNRGILARHKDPSGIALVICTLHRANLLNGVNAQTNLDALEEQKNPLDLNYCLRKLYTSNLLTQENFNSLITHSNTAFANSPECQWSLIPDGALTQEKLTKIFSIFIKNSTNHIATQIAFVNYVMSELFGIHKVVARSIQEKIERSSSPASVETHPTIISQNDGDNPNLVPRNSLSF